MGIFFFSVYALPFVLAPVNAGREAALVATNLHTPLIIFVAGCHALLCLIIHYSPVTVVKERNQVISSVRNLIPQPKIQAS
jgi:hypothetical protein